MSLSWMESVPYWLKQHERTSSLNTFIQIFVIFFFIYFPLIKASTLDNNIVSLLDFCFFFWTPSYRYLFFSLSLSLSHPFCYSSFSSFSLSSMLLFTLSFSPVHSFTHLLTRLFSHLFSHSLSLSLSKNISWWTTVLLFFMHYLIPTFSTILRS